MITTVSYSPAYLAGAYNPIIWSFLSDKIAQPDFKYVIDIYKDGTKVLRLKQRPNPSSYGMVDLSMIAQGYLKVTDPNNPLAQGETSINVSAGNIFQNNGTMSAHFYIKVGEEYSTSGVLNIYNGVTNAIGDPAYAIYSGKSAFSGLPVHVWPSSVPYRQQQYAMSNTYTASGAYGQNPETGRIYDHGFATAASAYAYPLMHNQLEQDLYTFDKMILSWIYWSAFPATADERTIYGFRYRIYDSAGSLLSTHDIPCLTSNGCGPRTTCSAVITNAQLNAEFDIIHTLVSPEDLATFLGIALPTGGSIKIAGHKRSSGCTFGARLTEEVTINLLEYCEPLYPRVRMSWLNDLGSRDYMNFTMLTEKSLTATQAKYSQEEINWSNSTPVPLSTQNVPGSLATLGGDKIYNKEITTSYKVQTDWLDQEQVDLLEGLLKSPQVLAYVHTGAAFDDDFPYQVTVKQTAYTSKNVRQNKLTQATFDVDVTLTQKMQNT